MSDNKQPQEFDFFQEALKAFDVPTLQETPKPSAPIEAAPVPVAREETTDAQPLKPAFWQKWWPAILCAAICIALLVSFLPRTEKTQRRGENWVYGRLSIVAEEMLILVTNAGERWYVELDGQEVPEMPQVGSMSLWVFYNGEPKDIDELNCTKKVKATFVCNTSGKMVSDFTQYGWIYDQITFDLDGDGKREQWLLCNGHVPGIDSFLSSSIAPAIRSYRLIALEEDGSEKYNVPFYPTISGSHVLNSIDGELCLIGVSGEDYVITAICLSGGQVTFECNDVPIDNEPPLIVTSPLMTLPPTEPPTEPPTGPAPSCQIRFSLLHTTSGAADTGWREVPYEEISGFKNTLDTLSWEVNTDEAIIRYDGAFDLSIGGEVLTYSFTHDGMLLREGKVAQMKSGLFLKMIRLMGQSPIQQGNYEGQLDGGETLLLSLGDGGKFDLRYQESAFSGWLVDGCYGVIGEYLYFANGYGDSNELPMVCVFRIGDNKLKYCAELSTAEDAWDVPDDLQLFYEGSLGARMQFALFRTPEGAQNNAGAVTTSSFFLAPEYAQRIVDMLDEQKWWTDVKVSKMQKVGYFTVQAATDEETLVPWQSETYYLTTDGYLVRNNQWCSVSDIGRSYLEELLQQNTDPLDPVAGSYTYCDNSGRETYFHFMKDGTFECIVLNADTSVVGDNNEWNGKYVVLGDVAYLFYTRWGSRGLLFTITDNGLVFNQKMSSVIMNDIPDGAVFARYVIPAPEDT